MMGSRTLLVFAGFPQWLGVANKMRLRLCIPNKLLLRLSIPSHVR
jgi:hypothetical protein